MSKKFDLQPIIDSLMTELLKMKDGESSTTCRLLVKAGYPKDQYDTIELLQIHGALCEAAQKNGITLDLSAYDDKIVGFPFVMEFVVRKG